MPEHTVVAPHDHRTARHAAFIAAQANLRGRTGLALIATFISLEFLLLLAFGPINPIQLALFITTFALFMIVNVAIVSGLLVYCTPRRPRRQLRVLRRPEGTALIVITSSPRGHDSDIHLTTLSSWPFKRGIATQLTTEILAELDNNGTTASLTTLPHLVGVYEGGGFVTTHRTWYRLHRMTRHPNQPN